MWNKTILQFICGAKHNLFVCARCREVANEGVGNRRVKRVIWGFGPCDVEIMMRDFEN